MSPGSSDVIFRFGGFECDLGTRELRKAGTRVRLQEQPWQVLLALLEDAGRIVTRASLRERLWPTDTFVDFDHSLNIAINKIRDVLDDDATKPQFIETIPRRGYRFIASVERIVPQPAAPVDRPMVQSTSRRIPWLAIGGVAAVALAIVTIIAGRSLRTSQFSGASSGHTIAVLPLRNLSPGADGDYFSDGLTTEIIYNLSIIDGLEVKSGTSSFQFKNTVVDIRDVGRRLQADWLLEGTVLRAAGRLRLDIALVRVA